jgi:hypothetical protein
VFDSWQKIFEENEGEIIDAKEADVPDSDIGKLAVGGQHALVRIYADALKDKKANWKKDEAAKALNRWVRKVEKEENDWHKTTDRIVSGKYGGKDKNGDMIIVDGSGDFEQIYAGGGLPLPDNWALYPSWIAGAQMVAGKGGVDAALLSSINLKVKKTIENTKLTFELGVDSYKSPPILGEKGMLDDGSFELSYFLIYRFIGEAEAFKLSRLNLGVDHKAEFDKADLVVGGSAGLIGVGPNDYMEMAMTALNNHYWPYIEGGSSSALGR